MPSVNGTELEKEFQRRVIKMIHTEFPHMWLYKASDKFTSGIPDIVGCCRGIMWAIELKVGKNEPSELQKFTMGRMHDAGALVIWASNIHGMDYIREFLKGVDDLARKSGSR